MLAIAFAVAAGTGALADAKGDEASVRVLEETWLKAYNAADVDVLVALYADDAVLAPPGAPSARGKAAIRAFYAKETAELAKAGVKLVMGGPPDLAVSGIVAWDFGTFVAKDKGGTTIDAGKYVTAYKKVDGRWLIARDTWNSDGPQVTAAPAAMAAEPAKK